MARIAPVQRDYFRAKAAYEAASAMVKKAVATYSDPMSDEAVDAYLDATEKYRTSQLYEILDTAERALLDWGEAVTLAMPMPTEQREQISGLFEKRDKYNVKKKLSDLFSRLNAASIPAR